MVIKLLIAQLILGLKFKEQLKKLFSKAPQSHENSLILMISLI